MLKLKVPDMSCGHCVRAVEQAILALDPGAQVKVDLASTTVDVETAVTAQAIAKAIKEAGYERVEQA